jgi:hypothetical protein
MKKVAAPKVPAVNCRNKTAEECDAIAKTLREAYAKGRRYRKVGFSPSKTEGKAK